jgi:hypothetical protein
MGRSNSPGVDKVEEGLGDGVLRNGWHQRDADVVEENVDIEKV